MKTTKRIALMGFPLLILTLTGCGGTPTPAYDGELPPAGLPGEPIDPQFDGACIWVEKIIVINMFSKAFVDNKGTRLSLEQMNKIVKETQDFYLAWTKI